MRSQDEAKFHAYVSAHLNVLRRTAYLMCGDWHEADDLVQESLCKLYLSWTKIRTEIDLHPYVRQILVRSFIDVRRSARWRREDRSGVVPERGYDPTPDGHSDVVRAALDQLAPSMRAMLVLRYFEDLSIEETAAVMKCSIGNVKSQTARALSRIRVLMVEEGW
ncbi:SigE family RNA polymerase sigma factor [Geodermatophilus maliterrae]|uniref:SigE family RNA polymerase sigma factor n=1 Tax=Geodermatophilus maliterrae TaxID=3162531 RepID=A0ABV3XM35_9ACTN